MAAVTIPLCTNYKLHGNGRSCLHIYNCRLCQSCVLHVGSSVLPGLGIAGLEFCALEMTQLGNPTAVGFEVEGLQRVGS